MSHETDHRGPPLAPVTRKQFAPPWYHLMICALEARRYALGLSMAQVDTLAGIADRSYAKAVHCDRESGRQASPQKIQLIFNVLFPDGAASFAIVPAEPGSAAQGNGVENCDYARRKIKTERAYWVRADRTQRMREIGSLGGKKRLVSMTDKQREECARKASQARWQNGPKHA